MIITVWDGPDGGHILQPLIMLLLTIRFEEVIGIVAIVELFNKFNKYCFWVSASFEPGVALLFTVRLT